MNHPRGAVSQHCHGPFFPLWNLHEQGDGADEYSHDRHVQHIGEIAKDFHFFRFRGHGWGLRLMIIRHFIDNAEQAGSLGQEQEPCDFLH
ncbi:MAG: hypothetical protein WB791_03560 [Waddliaceae bacterium]